MRVSALQAPASLERKELSTQMVYVDLREHAFNLTLEAHCFAGSCGYPQRQMLS